MRTPRAACLDASQVTRRCRRAPARRRALDRSPAFEGNRPSRPAAGIFIGLLAAGAAVWVALSVAPDREQEDWRMAVVEYMELYTSDTFALSDPDPSIQAKKLRAVGDKVGTALTTDSVAVPGASRRRKTSLTTARLPRLALGRGRLRRLSGRAGAVLHYCKRRSGCGDALGEARGFVALLMVLRWTGLLGDWPLAQTADRRSRANARKAILKSCRLSGG